MMNKANYAKIFLGLVLIATGVLFVLVLAGVTPIDRSTIIPLYWPSLVIILGVYLLLEAIRKRTTKKAKFSKIYFSLSVVTVGLAFLENNINYISETQIPIWGLIAALIVIYIGISIMFFNYKDPVHKTYVTKGGKNIIIDTDFVNIISDDDTDDEDKEDGKKKKNKSKTNQSHFIGELRLGDTAWVLQDSDYSIGVGDIHIDVTTAFLEEGETILNLSGWVGDIVILLPDDLAVDINASASVGEVSLIGLTNGTGSGPSKSSGVTSNKVKFKSENYESALKKLRVIVSLNIGEITIKQV